MSQEQPELEPFLDEGIVNAEEPEDESSSAAVHDANTSPRQPNRPLQTTQPSTNFQFILWLVVCSLFAFLEGQRYQAQKDRSAVEQAVAAATVMDRLRFEAAMASFDIIEADTQDATAASFLVDISPFYNVVDRAVDTVGIRRVMEELLESQQWAVAMTKAAQARGYKHFYVDHKQNLGQSQPYLAYRNIPSERFHSGDLCTGCIWWLRHYIGAIIADKLMREHSLLLDAATGTRLYNASSFFVELRRVLRMDYVDIGNFHLQHGFLWHYMTATHPDLDSYPLEVAQDVCGEMLYRDEYVEDVYTDIGRECRHGFGHAIFYLLAARETGLSMGDEFSARQQFRSKGGFVLSDDAVCLAKQICDGAPQGNAHDECLGGFRHSYKALSDGTSNRTQHVVDVMKFGCG